MSSGFNSKAVSTSHRTEAALIFGGRSNTAGSSKRIVAFNNQMGATSTQNPITLEYLAANGYVTSNGNTYTLSPGSNINVQLYTPKGTLKTIVIEYNQTLALTNTSVINVSNSAITNPIYVKNDTINSNNVLVYNIGENPKDDRNIYVTQNSPAVGGWSEVFIGGLTFKLSSSS